MQCRLSLPPYGRRVAFFSVLTLYAVVACSQSTPAKSPSGNVSPLEQVKTVFTDTALFRRICMQADSGLTPAARRCTPRDQRVRVQ